MRRTSLRMAERGDSLQTLTQYHAKIFQRETGKQSKLNPCDSSGSAWHRTYQEARETYCCTGCTRDAAPAMPQAEWEFASRQIVILSKAALSGAFYHASVK